MKSSLRLDVSVDARRDFRSILRYTREVWGERQRNTYGARLESAMERLTHYPFLGEPRDDLRPGLRTRKASEHIIYYRVDEEAVTVLRLLHHTMDQTKLFKE